MDTSSVHASNPRWLAPEALKDNVYGFKADVYSFGIILWELLTWQQPWEECGAQLHSVTIYNWVLAGQRPDILAPDELPAGPCPVYNELVELITQCWSQDPDKRPDFRSIVERLDELLRIVVKTEVSAQNNAPYRTGAVSEDVAAFGRPAAMVTQNLNAVSPATKPSGRMSRRVSGSPANLSPRRSPPPLSPFLETMSSSNQHGPHSPRVESPEVPNPFRMAAMQGTPWQQSSEGQDPPTASGTGDVMSSSCAIGQTTESLPAGQSSNGAGNVETADSQACGSSDVLAPSPFKKGGPFGAPQVSVVVVY